MQKSKLPEETKTSIQKHLLPNRRKLNLRHLFPPNHSSPLHLIRPPTPDTIRHRPRNQPQKRRHAQKPKQPPILHLIEIQLLKIHPTRPHKTPDEPRLVRKLSPSGFPEKFEIVDLGVEERETHEEGE